VGSFTMQASDPPNRSNPETTPNWREPLQSVASLRTAL
jgi:hypothetical protein